MGHLAIRLFGSYQILLDGFPLRACLSDKGRALLAYLAVEHDRPHTRERLVGLFWPEQGEGHARGSLSQALHQLRQVLKDPRLMTGLRGEIEVDSHIPFLIITPQEIQLNPQADIETDTGEFLHRVAAGKLHAHLANRTCDECLENYQQAARLYAGDFLEGFYLPRCLAFEEWATIQREFLRLEMISILSRLVTFFERRGELDTALEYARRMVQLDQVLEAGNLIIIRLLSIMDRREDALAHYGSFHHTLAVQLGAEPGMETKSLYQRLRNEEAGIAIGYLPANLTPFIGRQRELDELWIQLRDPGARLICVLGPGGCGKTRLALEAARTQRYYFKDGVYYIPLSTQVAGSSLLAVIAEGLGFTFRDRGDPKRQLLNYLRNKKILVLLDSFEMVAENAGFVAEILSASEGCKFLVTSRVRLNISGESIFPLGGMSAPPQDTREQIESYSSVELFLQAAGRVIPGYQPDNLQDVGRICRLVEGMPLSLLLASSWVGDYSLSEIAEQISQSLDFLSVKWTDLPERQRSLRATFEYSWNMLSTAEQVALMSLTVLRKPFTLPAAQRITAVSSQVLHELVGKSFLAYSAEGHYQMHDLVRQYSLEKLREAADGQEYFIRDQHSQYFLQLAASWSRSFKGRYQASMLKEADKVIDDVQAAWEWAARHGELEGLSSAAEGFLLYYFLRYRFQEGESACKFVIDVGKQFTASGERQKLEGWLLAWQAYYNRLLGRAELARECCAESSQKLELAEAAGQDVSIGQAILWRERGYLSSSLPEQLDSQLRSAKYFEKLGDPWWQAISVSWAGEIANRLGDRVQSYDLHQQAVVLSREAGEPLRLAYTLRLLAYYLLIFGPWDRGFAMMKEAAMWDRSVGDMGGLASADLHMGIAQGWTGRYHEACISVESAIEKYQLLGDHYFLAYGTLALAIGQMNSGWYEQAAHTFEKDLEAARQDGFRREEAYCLAQRSCLGMLQGEKTQALAEAEQSVASFRQMGFAGELGMALGGLALAQHQAGHDKQARESLLESIKIFVKVKSRFTLFTLAAAVVMILADAGRWEEAVEAYAAVMTDPIVANSCWFNDLLGDRMERAREQLTENTYRDAENKGREGELFEVLARLSAKINSWALERECS